MDYFEIPAEKSAEPASKTIEYYIQNRNFDKEKQCLKVGYKEQTTINVADCKIYWRGSGGAYLIVEYKGIVLTEEYRGQYLKQAVDFMELQNPQGWKTIDKLIALRNGIRQTEANCCGYVDEILMPNKMTLAIYNQFMKLARAHDVVHHGEATF